MSQERTALERPSGNAASRRRLHILGAALIFLACLAATMTVLGDPARRAFLYVSDALFMPSLARDLVAGGHLGEWTLPRGAPRLFPDFLLYLPCYLATRDLHLSLALFATAQATLMALGAALAGWAAAGRRAALLALLSCATWLLSAGVIDGDLGVQVFRGSYHFGAFVVLLFEVALTLLALQTSRRPVAWLGALGAALLAAVNTGSDATHLPQGIAPLALALSLRAGAAREVRPLLLATLLVAASVGGYLTLWALAGADSAQYQPGSPNLSVVDLGSAIFEQSASKLAVWSVATLAVAAWVAQGLRRCGTAWLASPLGLLGTFILGSVALSFGVAWWLGLDSNRYVIPGLLLPFVLGPVLLAGVELPRRAAPLPWIAAALLCLSAAGLGASSSGRLADWAAFYPPEIRCVDDWASARGLHNGLAGDEARSLAMLSHKGLFIVAVSSDMRPFHNNNSLSWYRGRAFGFAVRNIHHPAALLRDRVEPLASERGRCGDYEVYRFAHPLTLAL